METRSIFSKLNIRDYNNELEKILENKLFSLDVKNFLLSMLYKIENGYEDYKTIKVEVIPQRDFIKYLLKIIKEKCTEIQFYKLENNEKEQENTKLVVDKQSGKIYCKPNEKDLLSAILYMGQVEIGFIPQYAYTSDALEEMIQVGSNSNNVEVIRDFNGWSWDSLSREIENIEYNIVYQTILLSTDKALNYINNPIIIQDLEEEKRRNLLLDGIKTESFIKNEKYITLLNQISMRQYLKGHQQEKMELIKLKIEKEELLKLINNKKEFIEQKTKEKKKYTEEIENIDKIANNTNLLKEEYLKRNENLPNKEKIFSISHLSEILERERNELLEKIKKCNNYITPKEFIKEKEKLEKEVKFLNSIGLEEIQTEDNINNEIKIEQDIIDFCNEFFKNIEKKIANIQEKNEIKEWLYKIRYYSYVPVDESNYLKDVKKLEKGFKKIKKLLIKKAIDNKLIDNFTEDEELAYNVIDNVLKSRIINLENININCKYGNEILQIEYYDGNILENKVEIKRESVKIKRKIKLFI